MAWLSVFAEISSTVVTMESSLLSGLKRKEEDPCLSWRTLGPVTEVVRESGMSLLAGLSDRDREYTSITGEEADPSLAVDHLWRLLPLREF